MFSALRKRIHVSPATLIASLALVFAMTGGAYAAKKYLITSTKQISPSVLKSFQGKAGPAGAPGAAGAQGAAGPAGPQGPGGSGGARGETGPEGKKGETGATGPKGKEGPSGAIHPGETLPSGASETGTWSLGELPAGSGPAFLKTAISFTIPLAAPIQNAVKCGEAGQPACVVNIFESTTIPSGCSGTVVGTDVTELKAESGNLCVWVAPNIAERPLKAAQISALDPEAGDKAGAVGTHGGLLSAGAEEESAGEGTWAVTG